MTHIHPTAVVEPGARLGTEVSVGPFCYVQAGAEIGDGCVLQSHVSVLAYSVLGPRCCLHAGAVVGGLPQDTGFKGGESRVRIGEGCILREGVTVNRGTAPGSETVIGNRCMLMANSHCAHNTQVGDDVTIANCSSLAGYVSVGSRAFISAMVGVHQFVRIGAIAMVGISAVVTKDVPPFCTLRPSTENGVGGMNIVGMRRAGMSAVEREAVKSAFKVLYRSGLNVHQALARLDTPDADPLVRDMIAFIRASKRGICATTIRYRGAGGRSPLPLADGESAGNGGGGV